MSNWGRVLRGKFLEIYANLSGNFRKFVKDFLFHFIRFYYNNIKTNSKHVFDKQLSKSLFFNFMHYIKEK